jgi:hypothetical protein
MKGLASKSIWRRSTSSANAASAYESQLLRKKLIVKPAFGAFSDVAPGRTD